MSLLTNNQIQANIIADQAKLKKSINQLLSGLNATIASYEKLSAFLHEEALAGEIVDNQDSNKNLGMIGRKADKLREYADRLDALKAVKGADNSETATNMTAFKTSISYDHAEKRAEYEPES